jgi:hypothetical protein
MSLSTAASAATVAKCAIMNDNNSDDGNRNNVVIPQNTEILINMMEDPQSNIEKQLKYWGKIKGRGECSIGQKCILRVAQQNQIWLMLGWIVQWIIGRCQMRPGIFDIAIVIIAGGHSILVGWQQGWWQ